MRFASCRDMLAITTNLDIRFTSSANRHLETFQTKIILQSSTNPRQDEQKISNAVQKLCKQCGTQTNYEVGWKVLRVTCCGIRRWESVHYKGCSLPRARNSGPFIWSLPFNLQLIKNEIVRQFGKDLFQTHKTVIENVRKERGWRVTAVQDWVMTSVKTSTYRVRSAGFDCYQRNASFCRWNFTGTERQLSKQPRDEGNSCSCFDILVIHSSYLTLTRYPNTHYPFPTYLTLFA